MTTTPDHPKIGAGDTVYVKPLTEDEIETLIPEDVRSDISADEDLFGVHSGDSGERLAIVVGRDAAFAAARAHKLKPRSVH